MPASGKAKSRSISSWVIPKRVGWSSLRRRWRQPDRDPRLSFTANLAKKLELIRVVDHDRRAALEAELEHCPRLHRSGHHDGRGFDSAIQDLAELTLARHVDAMPEAACLVDEASAPCSPCARRRGGTARLASAAAPFELGRVSRQRPGLDQVDRRAVLFEQCLPDDPDRPQAPLATARAVPSAARRRRTSLALRSRRGSADHPQRPALGVRM